MLVSTLAALACAVTTVGPAAAVGSAAPRSSAVAAAPAPAPSWVCPPLPRPSGTCANRNLGKPRLNAPMRSGNHFSYPNRSALESVAIRNRVLNMINSTWGWYTTDAVASSPEQWKRGSIKMTTWSYNDPTMANALIAARRRGVSVQIIAASTVNRINKYKPWRTLKSAFNSRTLSSADNSAAWECGGACRGGGGAAHAKYFLFDDVGTQHTKDIVVQTSMNLTLFAYKGQWNQATVMWNADVYDDFLTVFRLAAGKVVSGYRNYPSGSSINNIFFPGGRAANDPILDALNQVRCTGATAGGANGRTRVRVIQYAIHQARGTAIAKKLRSLWNSGCDVRIIYSLTSRPVLGVLRSRSGRGPIPMKQSVIKNRKGEIVKYNHSKWLAIAGNYAGRSTGTYTVLPGSANWADLSYRSDEQTQHIFSYAWTRSYFTTFDKTWRQGNSRTPAYGRVGAGARSLSSVPEAVFGKGVYKYMSEGG